MSKKDKEFDDFKDNIRTSLTLPADMWRRINQIAESSRPKLSANQVTVMLLDYALRDELKKIEWIFNKLPNSEKGKK